MQLISLVAIINIMYYHFQYLCRFVNFLSLPPMCTLDPLSTSTSMSCMECMNIEGNTATYFFLQHCYLQAEPSACQPLSEMIGQVVKKFQDETPTLLKLLSFSERGVNIAEQIGVNYLMFGMI
ncbi:hypothetical protein EMCRGX_G006582 [Ephydatia muelleri]